MKIDTGEPCAAVLRFLSCACTLSLFLDDSAPWLHTFFLGWVVTVLSGITAYPIDTVKRRMMMTSGERVKYSGAVDCFRQIVAQEGPRALFRGAAVNVVRGVAGAGVLSGFDHFKKVIESRKERRQSQVSL